jgi:hypothetical protein
MSTSKVILLHVISSKKNKMDHKYPICPIQGCCNTKVGSKDSFYVCEKHGEPTSCQHCGGFPVNTTERLCKGVGSRILCNKCFEKYELVKFKFRVCCFARTTCLKEQQDGSIFCRKHADIKLCHLCLGYGDRDVAEYKDLGRHEYCGQCTEKIYQAYLQDKPITVALRDFIRNRQKAREKRRAYKK